jgi:voltage-gated potassium channel
MPILGSVSSFLVDFCVQLITAKSKMEYMKWGWIDLLSSIPMVGPMRWGRVARIVRILRLLRGVKSAKMISTYIAKRRSDSAFAVAAFIALLTIVFSSVAVLHVEREYPDANITTAEDAL